MGEGPEPDDPIVQEILALLLAANPAGGIAGEPAEDEALVLIGQLTPDRTFELGGSVEGVAEIPDAATQDPVRAPC